MVRIIELFAGIGACSTALKRLGIDLEIVDAVEIDKYAIKSFNAIHGTNFEVQDICEWDKDLKDIDLITHGSPCQDFSVAGKQAGGDIGSGTRSSLMYETIRIVGKIRPKYVLWENVKNLLSKKHKHNFDAYIETMNILGYNSYYQVLNAKNYGIPQNRERVFTVSIRKDIDDKSFRFPEKEELKLRLKDMLEEEVDEKYYLSDVQINRIKTTTYNVGKTRIQEKDYCDTLCARDWKDPKCVQVGELDIKGHDSIKRVYSDEGISPTLTDMQGGNRQPKILEEPSVMNPLKGISGYSWQFEQQVYDAEGITRSVKAGGGSGNIPKIMINNATKKGYDEAIDGDSINLAYPNSTTRRGRVGHQVSQTLQCNDSIGVVVNDLSFPGAYGRNFGSKGKLQDIEKECDTLQAAMGNGGGNIPIINNCRIRKLTPKECWRLMGFSDEDFEKAQGVPTSNSQLYKQAGNSIVVNVLEKIFKKLLEEESSGI